jgi:hypothetical protein
MSHVYVLTHWSEESGVYEYNGVFSTPASAMKYVGQEYCDETVKWELDNTGKVWRFKYGWGAWAISSVVPR